MPSRRHRSFTVTSRRNPSRTIRIFSSGMYLRRVAALTRLTKDLVCSVRSSAASALPTCDWDTSAPFLGYSTLSPGAHTTFKLSGFQPFQCVPFSLTVYNCDNGRRQLLGWRPGLAPCPGRPHDGNVRVPYRRDTVGRTPGSGYPEPINCHQDRVCPHPRRGGRCEHTDRHPGRVADGRTRYRRPRTFISTFRSTTWVSVKAPSAW